MPPPAGRAEAAYALPPPTERTDVVFVTSSEFLNLPEKGEPAVPEALRPYTDDETYRWVSRKVLPISRQIRKNEVSDPEQRGPWTKLFIFLFLIPIFWPALILFSPIICPNVEREKKEERERVRRVLTERAREALEPLTKNGLHVKVFFYKPETDRADHWEFTLRFTIPEGPVVATPDNSLAQLVLDEYTRQKIESPNSLRLYLLHRSTVEDLAARRLPVPVFQELRREGLLHCRSVDRYEALRGALGDVLALSYTWEGSGVPDSTGDRLQALAAHLKQHADVEFVWWDYACLPQNTKDYTRSVFEQAYFKDVLSGGVNIIYLSAKVLSLVNANYTQRFWPQFEYVLANRAASERGLEPFFGRSAVRCIQSLEHVTAEQSKTLRAQWGEKTTAEVIEILGKPDVMVTNASDKTKLLGKLPGLEEELAMMLKSFDPPGVLLDCV